MPFGNSRNRIREKFTLSESTIGVQAETQVQEGCLIESKCIPKLNGKCPGCITTTCNILNPTPPVTTPSGTNTGWEVCNFQNTIPIGSSFGNSQDGVDPSCIPGNVTPILETSNKRCLSNVKYRWPYNGTTNLVSKNCTDQYTSGFPVGKMPCVLHGGWSVVDENSSSPCSNGKYSTSTGLGDNLKLMMRRFIQVAKKDFNNGNDNKTRSVKDKDGKTYTVHLSYGHGVLDGKCGDLALIEFKNTYLLNLQAGPRAWSLEIGPSNILKKNFLNEDNSGIDSGQCSIPNVKKFEWTEEFKEMIMANSNIKP